jgi:acyl carrier protein
MELSVAEFIISEIKKLGREIDEEHEIVEVLDSLDLIELAISIEEEYNVNIGSPQTIIGKWMNFTVSDLSREVVKMMVEKDKHIQKVAENL